MTLIVVLVFIYFRMSGSRWVITPSWLSGSVRSFCTVLLYNSCHLVLVSSASVRSVPFLSFIVPIFVWDVPLVFVIFSIVFPILLFPSISLHCSLKKPFFFFKFILIGGELLYSIVVVFAMHWPESAISAHVSPSLEPPSHLPPISSLWVVPGHQLWVPCFMHWACTGHLFYIWYYTCFNAIFSNLSYFSLLFLGTLYSDGYIFPFLLCFLLLFFSQLFVRPLQTIILPFCISFSWGWFWSLPPVQC